jgi:hypothetical protein
LTRPVARLLPSHSLGRASRRRTKKHLAITSVHVSDTYAFQTVVADNERQAVLRLGRLAGRDPLGFRDLVVGVGNNVAGVVAPTAAAVRQADMKWR